MKSLIMTMTLTLCACVASAPAFAKPPKTSVLDNDPDLFALVTPDRLLGDMSRRKWLTLWPKLGREYWAAWDCKDKGCDTPKRAHIRATAKLIPRNDNDPKPVESEAGAGDRPAI